MNRVRPAASRRFEGTPLSEWDRPAGQDEAPPDVLEPDDGIEGRSRARSGSARVFPQIRLEEIPGEGPIELRDMIHKTLQEFMESFLEKNAFRGLMLQFLEEAAHHGIGVSA